MLIFILRGIRFRWKKSQEFMGDRSFGNDRRAEITVEQGPDIIEKLFPDGLIEAHVMAEFGKPLR